MQVKRVVFEGMGHEWFSYSNLVGDMHRAFLLRQNTLLGYLEVLASLSLPSSLYVDNRSPLVRETQAMGLAHRRQLTPMLPPPFDFDCSAARRATKPWWLGGQKIKGTFCSRPSSSPILSAFSPSALLLLFLSLPSIYFRPLFTSMTCFLWTFSYLATHTHTLTHRCMFIHIEPLSLYIYPPIFLLKICHLSFSCYPAKPNTDWANTNDIRYQCGGKRSCAGPMRSSR